MASKMNRYKEILTRSWFDLFSIRKNIPSVVCLSLLSHFVAWILIAPSSILDEDDRNHSGKRLRYTTNAIMLGLVCSWINMYGHNTKKIWSCLPLILHWLTLLLTTLATVVVLFVIPKKEAVEVIRRSHYFEIKLSANATLNAAYNINSIVFQLRFLCIVGLIIMTYILLVLIFEITRRIKSFEAAVEARIRDDMSSGTITPANLRRYSITPPEVSHVNLSDEGLDERADHLSDGIPMVVSPRVVSIFKPSRLEDERSSTSKTAIKLSPKKFAKIDKCTQFEKSKSESSFINKYSNSSPTMIELTEKRGIFKKSASEGTFNDKFNKLLTIQNSETEDTDVPKEKVTVL